MALNSSRIATTDKGRKLQVQLLQDIQNESALLKTPRTAFNNNSFQQVLSPSSTFSMRAGYFRPKKVDHLILKTEDTPRAYPNYLRLDPREYPNKHECTWTPPATVSARKDLASLSPLPHDIHHTLFHPDTSRNNKTTIRELNKVVSGDHSSAVLNLTSCDYPDYRPIKFTEGSKTVRDSVGSPLNMDEIDPRKTWINTLASSEITASDQQSSRLPARKSLLLKLPLTGSPSPYGIEGNSTLRTTVSSNFLAKKRQTIAVATKTLGFKTYRTASKVTEEKAEQIVEIFEEREREYEDLLKKLNKKVQSKHYDLEKASNYFSDFRETFSNKRKEIDEIAVANNKEQQRYKLRLKERQTKKFGKHWDEWSEFLGKAKTPQAVILPKQSVLLAKQSPKGSILSTSYNDSSFPVLPSKDSIAQADLMNETILKGRLSLRKVTSRTTEAGANQSRISTS